MLGKVREYIKQNSLILPGEKVLVGLSGGADSTGLLLILHELQKDLEFSLAAVHVNHGIRGEEAARDEEFSRSLCESLSVDFYVRHVEVPRYREDSGESLEEAARTLRYRAFAEVFREIGADRIALAHHREDQAETILFQMLRGSGLKGLSGMRPERDCYIRPLLCISREEILRFLQEKGQSYCTDTTNEEDEYSRNKLRHHVLPALKEVREDAVDKIAEAGEFIGMADAYFEEEAERFLEAYGTEKKGEVTLSAEALRQKPEILKGYIVRLCLEKLRCPMKDKGRVHIRAAYSLADGDTGKYIDLPGGFRVSREYERLVFRRPDFSSEKGNVSVEMRTFSYSNSMEIPEKEYTKWFDYDKIKGTVCLRYRETGDMFSTRTGTLKKLKDYMIDEKIPAAERGSVPLIAAERQVLWVIGYRMSEAFKVTENTKTVLEIQVKKERAQ